MGDLTSPVTRAPEGGPAGAAVDADGGASNFPNVDGAAGKVCSRCGWLNPADADVCERVGCRRALPGNRLAVKAGVFSRREREPVEAAVADMRAGIVADLGGDGELTTLERAYVARLMDVEVTLQLLAADMVERGLITPVGGVRRIYESFLHGVDRWDRLAQRLGLARRARRVPTLSDYLDERASSEEATR